MSSLSIATDGVVLTAVAGRFGCALAGDEMLGTSAAMPTAATVEYRIRARPELLRLIILPPI
jgi:hypothetical protein